MSYSLIVSQHLEQDVQEHEFAGGFLGSVGWRQNPSEPETTASAVGGGPGESRTPDLRFRKPLLYPSELQPQEREVDPNAALPTKFVTEFMLQRLLEFLEK
jgi:hypothetical protein